MSTHCDALIIGSGQAGPFLAARLVAGMARCDAPGPAQAAESGYRA